MCTPISNLGLAAYLLLLKYEMSKEPTREESGKFCFYFDIDESTLSKLYMKYKTSDFQKFDNAIVILKKKISDTKK